MSELVLIWGDFAVDMDVGAVSLPDGFGVYSKPANSKEREVIGIKRQEAPESRKSCSGAARGLVNRFPGFFSILTRPHF